MARIVQLPLPERAFNCPNSSRVSSPSLRASIAADDKSNPPQSSQGANRLSSSESRGIKERQARQQLLGSNCPESIREKKNPYNADPSNTIDTQQSGLKASVLHRRSKFQLLSDNQTLTSDCQHQYVATRTTTTASVDGSCFAGQKHQNSSDSNSSGEFLSSNNNTIDDHRPTYDALHQAASFSAGHPSQSSTDATNTAASPLFSVEQIPPRPLKSHSCLRFPSYCRSQDEDSHTNNNTQDSTPNTVNLLQSASLPDHEAQLYNQRNNHNSSYHRRQSGFPNHISSDDSFQLSDALQVANTNIRAAIHRKIAIPPSPSTNCDKQSLFKGTLPLSPTKCRSSSVDRSTSLKFSQDPSSIGSREQGCSPRANSFELDPRSGRPSDTFQLKQRLIARHKQLQQQHRLDGVPKHASSAKDSSPSASSSDLVMTSNRDKNSLSELETPKNLNENEKNHEDHASHPLQSTSTPDSGYQSIISGTMSLSGKRNTGDVRNWKLGKSADVVLCDESKENLKKKSSSDVVGVPPRPNKTKSRLAALQEKIVKFEEQLQMESEHRKAAGEGKLNVIKEALRALEKTLAAEVGRRLEANKTIQVGFEQHLAELEEKIDQTLEGRSKQVTLRLETLTLKLKEAETGAKEAIEVQAQRLRELTADIQIVASETHKIKDYITNEFQARRQRSEVISDKLMELEKQIETRVNLEKSVRERDVRKLEGAVEELKQHHVALDDVFQQELGSKFLELKNALIQETQAREQADDDIVQALNYYTTALQSALRIANSA